MNGRIIDEICSVIWDVLTEKGFVTPPSNVQEWRFLTPLKKSEIFHMLWGLLMESIL